MKTFYDVQQLLKQFGTYIYTKDKNADIELMQMELKELYDGGILSVREYQTAVLILKSNQTNK
ncbi:YqgQ family protein [Paenisporosarcina cavernae]|uniref:DUF910 family protein n=1 Tax=Paenisporosarcina cavernae TaxID=2320858 RepID=A0A385YSU8_9BACL|nr:YqgQ family protein [Paenisporosarcina cavernae]AYC29571.1 DUF910 family protein [Paenisporosarcina cavernae]